MSRNAETRLGNSHLIAARLPNLVLMYSVVTRDEIADFLQILDTISTLSRERANILIEHLAATGGATLAQKRLEIKGKVSGYV